MKKVLLIIAIIGLMSAPAYAINHGGKPGGGKPGNKPECSVECPPGPKGDKGDKGDPGIGIDGRDGRDGIDAYLGGAKHFSAAAGAAAIGALPHPVGDEFGIGIGAATIRSTTGVAIGLGKSWQMDGTIKRASGFVSGFATDRDVHGVAGSVGLFF